MNQSPRTTLFPLVFGIIVCCGKNGDYDHERVSGENQVADAIPAECNEKLVMEHRKKESKTDGEQ